MRTTINSADDFNALLENQQAIASQVAAIASLEGAIADYAATADKMRAALPDPGALERERENLLAAIAIGEKGQADLDALDSNVFKQQAQRKKDQHAVTGIAQTVAGLQRRLADEQGKLAQLRQAHPALMRRFLRAQAEIEGDKYATMGVALAASYRRLQALDALLTDGADRSAAIRLHGPALHVPAFALESVTPHAPPPVQGGNYVGSIYDERWQGLQDRQAQIEREKASFRALGLEIE